MSKNLQVSSESNLSMPIKNMIGIIILVASFVFGYTQITSRLTSLETSKQLMEADLLKKADQTPKNLEIYMLIEHNATQISKHQEQLDENVHTKVLLLEAEKKILKLEKDVEDLKNKFRKANGTH